MGLLKEKKDLITNLHLHAIVTHFPCALYPATSVFAIAALTTKNYFFGDLSFITLTIANLGAIVSILSGLYDRYYKYVRWDSVFRKKTILSVILIILGIFSCVVTALSICYNIVVPIFFRWIAEVSLILILPVLTIAIGYYGLILSYGRFGGKTSYKPDLSREIKVEPPETEIEGYKEELYD
ncbi:MAG: hypothetical protein HY350_00645 [Candidatus Omnitrophica bacterium]|nr:hypothetical protein [Candidatus Omnitrophota bacterium]